MERGLIKVGHLKKVLLLPLAEDKVAAAEHGPRLVIERAIKSEEREPQHHDGSAQHWQEQGKRNGRKRDQKQEEWKMKARIPLIPAEIRALGDEAHHRDE